jgi:hypothetical protein
MYIQHHRNALSAPARATLAPFRCAASVLAVVALWCASGAPAVAVNVVDRPCKAGTVAVMVWHDREANASDLYCSASAADPGKPERVAGRCAIDPRGASIARATPAGSVVIFQCQPSAAGQCVPICER